MKQVLALFTFLIFSTLQLSGQSLEFVIQQQLNSTANEFNLSAQDVSEWTITDNHVSKNSNVRHLYIRQQYQGIEIVGANASLHLMEDKKGAPPLSFHNNFQPNAATNIAQANASTTPQLGPNEAVAAAAKQLGYRITEPIELIKTLDETGNQVLLNKGGISLENIPAKLVYQADNNGNLKLAWDISILELNHINWWSIRVDAYTGEILDKNNWTLSCSFEKRDECQEETNENHHHQLNISRSTMTNHSSSSMVAGYNVYPVPVESPSHGPRTIVSDPSDAIASPYGWHDDNGVAGAEYTITRGNNVHAQEDRNGNNGTGYSPDGGASLNFDFPIDLTLEPAENEDAMITNLFYWNNVIHDVAYRLGFDEASGNFQENNYGKGGFGGDYVYADAQDGSGSNNANFSTPPDGSNPRMQMFLWTAPTPDVDGDLDNGIILHEYGHGISIRLTGGASTSSCLNNTEQMGEGWSDYWGVMLSMKATDQGPDKRGVGTYALNQPTDGNGIRTYPYSTDMTINPHTYDDISGLTAPHGVGSLWCAMIWEMSWELIEEHGFDEDIYQGTGGNNIAMQLVLEGMKLQPCSPGFVDGRDAILKADTALYAGANSCLIWRAFAKRGLGYSADQGSSSSKTDGTEAFDLPPGVNENCITTPDYAILINPSRKSACADSDFEYDVSVLAFNGYTGTVTISDDVFPAGTTSNLAETTFSSFPATTTWTITNTGSLAEGDHILTLNGTDGTIIHNKSATLEILPVADAPTLVAPANNSTVSSLNQTLSWSAATGASHYDLQIATDIDFNTIILDVSSITSTSYASGLLSPNTTYYWRVKSNSCATSSFNVFSFSVASACGQTFTDSGGADGDYENNEFQEWIFCPDNEGEAIIVNFTSFNLETAGSGCWDDLTIYDGNSTSAPSLGAYCGTSPDDLPNGGVIIATNETGCLTFVFDSDGSVLRSGWVATIECADCPVPLVNTIDTSPENCTDNDGSITIIASAVNPVEFVLTPNGGSEIINTTGVFSGLPAGDYTIFLRTQGDPDCASSPQNITLTNTTPTISMVNIMDVSCQDGADGSVTISTTSSGTFDYSLTPSGGVPIVNSTGVFSDLTTGDYTIAIQPIGATSCSSSDSLITVNTTILNAPTLVAPVNNSTVNSLHQTLSWSSVTGASHYDLQIATDAAFNTIILDAPTITSTSYNTELLSPNTTYYWRVRSNSCATSSYNTSSFFIASFCRQTFTDSGGENGSYGNNELQEWIFCPDNPGEALVVEFTSFELETSGSTSCWDDLTIYNGNSTSAPSLGAFCGTSPDDLPNGGLIYATNESGCLTFVFDSDGSVIRSGWVATINCLECLAPVVNKITTVPENCGGNDGSITITADAFNPVEYVLTSIGGDEIINTTGVFSDLMAGDYTILLRTQGDPDCASDLQNINLPSIIPTISEVVIIDLSCHDSADGSVTITPTYSGAYDYLLTPSGGTSIINATGVFSNLAAGDYTVAIQPVGDASCISLDSVITINSIIISPPTVTDFSLCSTDNSETPEALTATCSSDICNAITIEPNSPINASNSTVCETITVNADAQTVSEVYLSFVVKHTWVGDLSATLESPDGTIISLFDGLGRPTTSYGCTENNLNLIFADTASLTAAELENTCNPSSSSTTYTVEGAFQAIDLFSTLNGETATGDWKICFYDNYASYDHGTIESITLIVNPILSSISWWDAPTDGNLLHTGDTFDPVSTGDVDPNQAGIHTFYAQCECAGCPSLRTAATYEVGSGEYYFLDEDMDGYGDANTSIIVCSGDTPPSNYVSNFTDCNDAYDGDVMMTINDHPVEVEMHQANVMIISEGTIEPNVDLVTFQAGDVITLMPGFHAMAGSNFLAKIDSCGIHPSATLVTNNSSLSRQNPTISNSVIPDISLTVFPNPFIHSTRIAFQLPQEEKIALSIYDNFGRLIKTYYDGDWQAAGAYQVTFESENLMSGLFIAILRTEKSVISQRIVLTR